MKSNTKPAAKKSPASKPAPAKKAAAKKLVKAINKTTRAAVKAVSKKPAPVAAKKTVPSKAAAKKVGAPVAAKAVSTKKTAAPKREAGATVMPNSPLETSPAQYAASNLASPKMLELAPDRPYVAINHNRETCLVVDRVDDLVKYIPFAASGLQMYMDDVRTLHRDFQPCDYDPQRAAKKYLEAAASFADNSDVAVSALKVVFTSTALEGFPMTIKTKKTAAKKAAAKSKPSKPETAAQARKRLEAEVAEPKAGKKAAPKKVAAESEGKRGRASSYAGMKLTLLVKENPKRAGSASFDRYEFYKKAKTVDEFVAAGGTLADVAHDVAKEFIKVS